MAQIFHRSTNTISRVTIFGGAIFVISFVTALATINESPYITDVGVARSQPVPFSHKHHVGDEGIDCRYCHNSVEESSFAGIPPTKTCMNCHAQIWSDSAVLEPVRESFRTDRSIQWTRVHNLPGFVYFDHSIHIHKGVGCSTCHGRVDQMPLTWRENTLYMDWCLDCHRAPEKYLRPKDKVFDMAYKPVNTTKEEIADARELVSKYRVQVNAHNNITVLTSCSTCHR